MGLGLAKVSAAFGFSGDGESTCSPAARPLYPESLLVCDGLQEVQERRPGYGEALRTSAASSEFNLERRLECIQAFRSLGYPSGLATIRVLPRK